jgi:hypothetical protein
MPAAFAGGALSACTTLLGLGDYAVRLGGADATSDVAVEGASAGGPDALADAASPEATQEATHDAVVCDGDLTKQCYPCAPATQPQFLNACTSASCVAFDDTKRLNNLLPDGALPPLPSRGDGGAE